MKEVEPAVLEIEELVRANRFLTQLATGTTEPQNWTAGGALGMAAYTLASLPELASLAVGGTVGLTASARSAYLKWRKSQQEIEGTACSSTMRPVAASREVTSEHRGGRTASLASRVLART